MPLYLCPVKVQGEGAASGDRRGHSPAGSDARGQRCMIVGRGGGSMEDLWPFNEEIVAAGDRSAVGRR